MNKQLLFIIKYILPVVIFLTCLNADGQGSLSGKINGSKSQADIAGATISISDLNVSAQSDATGTYRLSNIPDGYYLVKVSAGLWPQLVELQ